MKYQIANAELAVGYVGPKSGNAWEEFEKASKRDDVGRFSFFETEDESCAVNFPGLVAPGFIYAREFDRGNVLTSNEDPAQIVGWLKKNSYPKIFELKDLYREVIWKEGHPALFLYSNIKDKNTHYHQIFQQASAQIKNMLFVTSGLSDEWQANIATSFGIGKEQVPMLLLMFNDEEN